DGREAEAVLPPLRCDAETLLDTLSAVREAFLGLAPRRLGSPALISPLPWRILRWRCRRRSSRSVNEAVRKFLSAFDGDREAFRETLHPEIEWYPIEKER